MKWLTFIIFFFRRPLTAPVFCGYQPLHHHTSSGPCQCHQKTQKQQPTSSVDQEAVFQQQQQQTVGVDQVLVYPHQEGQFHEDLDDVQHTSDHIYLSAPGSSYLIPTNPGPSANNSFVESGTGSGLDQMNELSVTVSFEKVSTVAKT